jgi:mono/diheme cytochrome c family protein
MILEPWPVRVLLLAAALMGGSCASTNQIAAPPVATLSGSPALLSHGREIYVTKCAKCHKVEPVRDYSRAKWEHEILPDMAEESKLSAADTAAVRAYVMAALRAPTA